MSSVILVTFDQEILTHRQLMAKIEQDMSLLYPLHIHVIYLQLQLLCILLAVVNTERVVVSIHVLLITISGIR